MPPTPPTDAELDTMIRARLASLGIDLAQLPPAPPPTPSPAARASCPSWPACAPSSARTVAPIAAYEVPGAGRQHATRCCRSRARRRCCTPRSSPPGPSRERPRHDRRHQRGRGRRRAALGRRRRPPVVPRADERAGRGRRLGRWPCPPSPTPAPSPRSRACRWPRCRPEALADITELTLAEASRLIRSGRLSPVHPGRGLPRPDRRLRRHATRRSTPWSRTRRWPGPSLGRRAADRPAPRHSARHQGQLLHRGHRDDGRTPTSSRASSRRSTPPRSPGSTGPAALVLGKTQMGPLATTRATTPDGVVTTVNAWTPAGPVDQPRRLVDRLRHRGRRAHGRLERRHPDRRLDHRPVQRAEPHRPQADHGPRLAVRHRPADLHPRPPRAARPRRHRRRDHADRDGRARTRTTPAPGPAAGAGPDPAATPVGGAASRGSAGATRVGVIPGYARAPRRRRPPGRPSSTSSPAIEDIEVVDVPLPDEWDLLTGTVQHRPAARADRAVPARSCGRT